MPQATYIVAPGLAILKALVIVFQGASFVPLLWSSPVVAET